MFLTNVECRRSFRVILFSRFDGVVVDSEEDVVDINVGSDASIPPVELRLYNTTEVSCMDLQYDPMTSLTRGQLATLKQKLECDEKKSGRKQKNLNSNRRSRRDVAVVDVHDETPSFLKIMPRKSPQDTSQTLKETSCTSGVKDISGDVPNNDIENDVKSTEKLFYEVSTLRATDTPDLLRMELHDALDTLCYNFRPLPTLPSDPTNRAEPLRGAMDSDKALYLPLKHCAFSMCSWRGNDTVSLADHIIDHHLDVLQDAMAAFEAVRPCVFENEQVLALSVYNEGIAMAVQRGAPLASFSIDRKCLQQYAYHLTHPDTKALVCFVCARRFVHVRDNKSNDMQMSALLTGHRDSKRDGTSMLFLGLNHDETLAMFG